MPRRFDHIDLRVPHLEQVRPFYEALLPALGFTRDACIPGWLQYESESAEDPVTEFFGITESPSHRPNENRIAFWAGSPAEIDRLAPLIRAAGALHIEGPAWESPDYYALFFQDPCGNPLEICHRLPAAP
jgi:catechol 2,3-dioxygenase-like lactoylglutathione lyase family enzyme